MGGSKRENSAWPLLWASIYVGSIFAFGLIYSNMTNDFLQSNMKDDPRYKEIDHEVVLASANLLNSIIGRPLDEDNPLVYLSLDNLIEAGRAESILLSATYVQGSSRLDLRIQIGVANIGVLVRGFKTASNEALDWRDISLFKTNEEAAEKGYLVLQHASFPQILSIQAPKEDRLRSLIIEWLRAQNSLVASVGSGYVRMLYFSAVTATTLGYGDIVPISDRARIIVTLQTVLSVITIGLFLNAIATRQRSND